MYLNKPFRNFHLRVFGIFIGKEKQVEKKEAPEELPKKEVEKPSKQVKEPPVQEEGFRSMMFNATFNNISVISWWSVLLLEETGVTCRKSLTNFIT
jgi:hypothetical protein